MVQDLLTRFLFRAKPYLSPMPACLVFIEITPALLFFLYSLEGFFINDSMASFSACVIACFLRSEDYRPHNSLEKSRAVGPPKNKVHRNVMLSLLVAESLYTLTAICGIIHL